MDYLVKWRKFLKHSGVLSKANLLLFLGLVIFSLLNIKNPIIAIAAIISLAIFVCLIERPLIGLMLFFIIIPFSETPPITNIIGGIQGLKIFNLLAIAVLMSFLISRSSFPVGVKVNIFIIGFISLFGMSILRSTPYIQEVYLDMWGAKYSLINYLQSYLMKPLLLFMPFILIVKFVRSREDIIKVVNGILISNCVLSSFILFLYVFATPDKGDFESVRQGFANVLSLHGNEIANFYIAAFPLMLAYLMNKKNIQSLAMMAISLCVVGLLYSRAAYFVIILSFFLFLLVSRRTKLIPILILIFSILILMLPSTMIDRALSGVESDDVNNISAGRVEYIWKPLILEYFQNPERLMVGGGRYFISQTNAFSSLGMFKVGHAHNMYLDMVVDSGILGLLFFLIFFSVFMISFIKTHPIIKDRMLIDILYAVEISIVSYFVRGMTDGTLFPTTHNSFTWIILGVGVAITYCGKAANSSQNSVVRIQ